MGWELIFACVLAKMIVDAWDQEVDAEQARWSAIGEDSYTAAHLRAQRDRALRHLEAMRAQGPRNPLWWPYVAINLGRAAWAASDGARARAGERATGAGRDAGDRWRATLPKTGVCARCGRMVSLDSLKMTVGPVPQLVCALCRSQRDPNRPYDPTTGRPWWDAERADAPRDQAGTGRPAIGAGPAAPDADTPPGPDGPAAPAHPEPSPTHRPTRPAPASPGPRPGEALPWSPAVPAARAGTADDPVPSIGRPATTDVPDLFIGVPGADRIPLPAITTQRPALGDGSADLERSSGVSDLALTGESTTLAILKSQLTAIRNQQQRTYHAAEWMAGNLIGVEIDSDTLVGIFELMDLLGAAAAHCNTLLVHVANRHNQVADAVAAAGGVQNVAKKEFYSEG